MSDLLPKIKEICRLLEIKPARSKGQNFLINEKIYDDIIAVADLKPDDTVLEVGPGLGFLTAKLAKKVKKVIAVELDDKLAAYLQTGIDAQGIDNVEIVNEDILRFDLDARLRGDDKEGLLPVMGFAPAAKGRARNDKKYKIAANLPYNITSIFLRQFLSAAHKPELMVLMLQKEVAERIVAKPPEMSILAVSVQYYADAKIIREVKAGNFWPEPEVDSAIIKLNVKTDPRLRGDDKNYVDDKNGAEDKKFFRAVKIGFSAKRKMLKNNLAAGLKIEPKIMENLLIKQGFNPKIRAEDLSLQDWQKLFAALTPFMV